MNKNATEGHPEAPIPKQRRSFTRYLLFVGSGPEGASGSVIATFRDEHDARRAFVNQRLLAPADSWARLTMVDATGRTRSSVGSGQPPTSRPVAAFA